MKLIQMTLATGSVFNIKPEVVLMAYCNFFQIDFHAFDYQIHRQALYHGEENFLPLSTPIVEVNKIKINPNNN